MNNSYTIYLIENLINHKVYIGQTVRKLSARIRQHKCDAFSPKRKHYHLHSAMVKYGFDNFQFSILDTASSKEELDKLEKWWVEIFQSTNPEIGYNINQGGYGPGIFSQETKEKIAQSHLGMKASEETRKKMSLQRMGNKRASSLTQTEVDSIREEYLMGATQQVLADKYGITQSGVSRIVNSNRWRE